MDDSEAQFALTSYSQTLWRELAAELPPQAEYLPCGSLWVAADGEEMDGSRTQIPLLLRTRAFRWKSSIRGSSPKPNRTCGPVWPAVC